MPAGAQLGPIPLGCGGAKDLEQDSRGLILSLDLEPEALNPQAGYVAYTCTSCPGKIPSWAAPVNHIPLCMVYS